MKNINSNKEYKSKIDKSYNYKEKSNRNTSEIQKSISPQKSFMSQKSNKSLNVSFDKDCDSFN